MCEELYGSSYCKGYTTYRYCISPRYQALQYRISPRHKERNGKYVAMNEVRLVAGDGSYLRNKWGKLVELLFGECLLLESYGGCFGCGRVPVKSELFQPLMLLSAKIGFLRDVAPRIASTSAEGNMSCEISPMILSFNFHFHIISQDFRRRIHRGSVKVLGIYSCFSHRVGGDGFPLLHCFA